MQTDLIGTYVEKFTDGAKISGVVRAAIPLTPGLMLWVETEDGSLRSIEAQCVRVRTVS